MNISTYIILIFSILVDFLLLGCLIQHALTLTKPLFNLMQYCTDNLLCIFRVVTCFGPVDLILNMNVSYTG